MGKISSYYLLLSTGFILKKDGIALPSFFLAFLSEVYPLVHNGTQHEGIFSFVTCCHEVWRTNGTSGREKDINSEHVVQFICKQ